MAKTKISEYDATAGNNTDINSINIDEGCSPSGINNAIRALMSHLKNWQGGTSGDTLPVASGGTGSTTAGDARTALGAAKTGANSDITSLTACTTITGLTTPLTTAQGGTGTASTTFANLTTNVTGTLPVTNGGTGLATLTANNVMLGNGTSTPSFVSPSTSGNVLTSNGTTWTSAAAGGIGVGQSWTDVAASRVSGTTYTNSTGKPIGVSFATNYGANNTTTVGVNGIQIMIFGIQDNAAIRFSSSFIVPNGHTYSITSPTGFETWAELR